MGASNTGPIQEPDVATSVDIAGMSAVFGGQNIYEIWPGSCAKKYELYVSVYDGQHKEQTVQKFYDMLEPHDQRTMVEWYNRMIEREVIHVL